MTIINTQKLYLRWLGMLLASAPLWKWSLLSSRPTSRAHDGSLRQGDPTGRRKLTTHLGSIHSPDRPLIRHPSTHQITQHGSTHWITQHGSTHRIMQYGSTHRITQYLSTHSASIYSPRIQSSGARVWHVIFFNLQAIRTVRISWINDSPVGPGHFTFLVW